MAATINPRDIQILGTTPRMVGVGLPPNIVVDPDNVDGLGLILNGIKRIWISATSQIFQIAKNDTVSPSSITLTANVRNLTATPTLTIVPGNGTMSVVPALTAGVFSFTEAQLTSNTVTLRLSLTEDSVTYTDDFTFVKVREGEDSLNGYLTNESHTVPADYLGNVTSYAGASGTFNLLLGTLDVRTVSTFAVASGGNPDGLSVAITASGSNAGNYVVTGGFPANKDTVTITFNATFGTTVFPKVLTLTKSKAGVDGSGNVTWVAREATLSGSTATKTSPAISWDADVYSVQGFTGGCYVAFTPGQTDKDFMVGLNSDPATSKDFPNIDFAIYIPFSGSVEVYESGVFKAAYSPYTVADVFQVRYVETGPTTAIVEYLKNGIAFRTTLVSSGLVLYADSSLRHPGTVVKNLVFGPTSAKGAAGVRGSKQFYVGLSGSTATWSDVVAASAASVDGGPVLNDQVTQYNNSVGFSQTKFWNGSIWVTVDAVIDGNLLVTGTVGASKVVVNAGVGSNVWFDPNYADSSAWQVASWGVLPQRVVLTDGITSGTAMQSPAGVTASARGAFRTPVVVGKKYRISVKARKSSTANGSLYVRLDVGSSRIGAYSDTNIGLEAISSVPTSWQEFSTTWVATSPWASVMVLLNYNGTGGYMEAQDIRIEEMNAAGLIVQGGIVADQIDSRGLSIKDAYGNIILAAGSALPIGYAAPGTVNADLVPSINAAQTTANNAALSASNAQSSANAANAAITNIGSDSILSKGEKPQVVQDWLTVDSERLGIVAQANVYGIVTERDNYNVAWGNLSSYLTGLSPAYNDTSQDTPINGASFRLYWVQLYDARQILLNKIADEAGKRAVWANVAGSGKPADNATVGATIGVDLNGQITAGNASTYIANAAIGTAQISELNASKIVAGTITTDKIQVGAATASASSAITFSESTIPASTSYVRNENLFSLTTTGAAVTVQGAVTVVLGNSNVSPLSTSVDHVEGEVALYIDGQFKRAFRIRSKAFYQAATGGNVWEHTFPVTYRETLSAGSHTFSIQSVSYFKTATSSSTTSAGLHAMSASVVAQENKV